jgi:hypothetical protein
MKIEKFNQLKSSLETFAFEKNFKKLALTLYWFSFLGNIFLVLFSFFFIKNVTDSIPELFKGQGIFFSVFVMLFMVGYELFKRFSFEQLTMAMLKAKKFSINILLGIAICLSLVAGSFYLSLNGAHRLIDTTEKIETSVDNTITKRSDSIANYYNKQIALTQDQIETVYRNNTDGLLGRREKASLEKYEKDIKQLDSIKTTKITALELKYQVKTSKKLDKASENNLAFAIMVFFLEFIILIGVAFDSYYIWGSYDNMKTLLGTAKFQEFELNLKLLRIFYQDGRRKKDEEIISLDKFAASCSMQNIDVNKTDLNNFLQLCFDLGILQRRKDNNEAFYVIDYMEAKQLIENQIYL